MKPNIDSHLKELIQKNFPVIQKVFLEKAEGKIGEILNDDVKLGQMIGIVYKTLPLPFKLAVKKELFLEICLRNRNKIFDLKERTQTSEKSISSPDSEAPDRIVPDNAGNEINDNNQEINRNSSNIVTIGDRSLNMTWKCVCKEDSNLEESTKCKNCGRPRPKYMGIKLEIESAGNLPPDHKAIWYMQIAYSYLVDAQDYMKNEEDLSEKLKDPNYNKGLIENEINKLKLRAEESCKKCLEILAKAKEINGDLQFEVDDGIFQSCKSIESDCYFVLASIQFSNNNFAQAIEYFKKSYDLDPNQVSIYNIAMATMNLPVEGGGFFGGKKKEAAIEAKREQEILLLKKTISYAPFSKLGIKSGRRLFEDYKLTTIDI